MHEPSESNDDNLREVEPLNVPAGQSVQTEVPVEVANVPAAQGWQVAKEVAPGEGE
jgi:hypothetical protein